MNSLKRITCVVLIVFVFAALAAPASAWQPDDVVGILPKRLQPLLEEDPGSGPSELGGLVADCVRWVAQTDLAIVPAGDLEQDNSMPCWRSYYPIYRSIWQMSH